ncbi:MAG: AraC family transcriptional regulator [Thermoanaerobaculia bacterium]|jgi:AraC-like DNA-binding protein
MLQEIRTKPVETLVHRTDSIAFGRFVCPASHPLFRDSGPCSYHTFVFPRTATRIRLAEGPSFVGDPTTVLFYNQHQRYERAKVSEIDACDWFVVADELLLDMIAPHDPAVRDRRDRPFRFPVAAAESNVYLAQRRLFDRARAGPIGERLEIEEAAIGILAAAIASAYASRGDGRRRRASFVQQERIELVKRAIAATPAASPLLSDLARVAGCSQFQLCRCFRKATGMTMTEYRHSLRMRDALSRLREGRRDLTEIALDLGYSSHSHFSSVFRRTFGMPPSSWRAIP